MSRISARIPDEYGDALEEVKQRWGMSKSEIVRDALRVWLKQHKDALPEHLEKDTTHEDIVKRNRHRMRRMTFKQRVHDKLRGFLEDDLGNARKFPPEPEKVENEYVKSLREEIDKEHEKYAEEYHQFLDDRMRWYKAQHPDSEELVDKDYDEIVRYVAEHLEADRPDFAKAVLNREKDVLREIAPSKTPKKVMQDAKELTREENWREEWQNSVRANWGEKADD